MACATGGVWIGVDKRRSALQRRVEEASAVSFRQNLGDMLNQVQYRHDSIVIKRDGKPVAALVDARLFERIEAGYAEVPEAEGLAEIDVAVAASRAGR